MPTLTESEPRATRAEILRAAEALAGRYDPVDSAVAKAIVRSPGHTDRQIRTLWTILGKYRAPLAELGIDHGALVPPPEPGPGPDAFLPAPGRVRFSRLETPKGRRIALRFAFDERINGVLKAFRNAPSSPPWWDRQARTWVIPEDFGLLEQLSAALRKAGLEAETDAELGQAQARAYEASRAPGADLAVPTKIELYPFQKAGVKYIEDLGGRAIVADEMGLGKTATALGFLARNPKALPALVLCPATIRANWYKEVRRFTSFRPLLVSSKTSLKAFERLGFDVALGPKAGYDVVVMNYDLFEAETPADWTAALEAGDPTALPLLVRAGQYALPPLQRAYERSSDIAAKQRLLQAISAIEKLGDRANRRRFVRVVANGLPLRDLLAAKFATLVCDEMHYLKESRSQRSMAAEEVSRAVRNVVGLTGTPLLNRTIEVWSQVRIVNRNVLPDRKAFGMRYCDGKVGQVQVKGAKRGVVREVLDFSGASNLDELERVLRGRVMIRRLKKDVLSELPPKIRSTVPLVLEKGMEEYRKEEGPIVDRLAEIKRERDSWKALLAGMDEPGRRAYLAAHASEAAAKSALSGVAIDEIEKLKLAAAAAKLKEAVRFILEAREQAGKVVVFAWHHATTDRLLAAFRKEGVKADFIDGRVAGPDREPVKERFQEGDLEVLVCGIRAASEGLTLTASHTVVFVEFDWNPGRHQQAEDRVHRIGQKVPPTIYYLVAVGTVEERIAEMIDSKREVANAALGEGERTMDEEGILDALLEGIVARRAA